MRYPPCKKDPLDITPDGRISYDQIFSSETNTGAYLNSCYNNIQGYGYKYFFFTMLAGFTDDAHDNANPTDNQSATHWYQGSLTPLSNPLDGGTGYNTNYYGQNWQGIRHCYVFLANIDGAALSNK